MTHEFDKPARVRPVLYVALALALLLAFAVML